MHRYKENAVGLRSRYVIVCYFELHKCSTIFLDNKKKALYLSQLVHLVKAGTYFKGLK